MKLSRLATSRGINKARLSVWGALIFGMSVFSTPVGHAQNVDRPNLEGTYLTQLVVFEDPRWRIEDHLCEFCSTAAFEYAQALLRDPQNDNRSLEELRRDVAQFDQEYITGLFTNAVREATSGFDPAEDPILDCEPAGLLRMVWAPLPFQIEQHDHKVILRYEWWNTERTVYLDGRGHPWDLAPDRLGHSIGWYDGMTLVVETTGFQPHIYGARGSVAGLSSSSQALVIERYTRSEEGRLDLEWTIADARMLRQPLIYRRSRLLVPDMEFLEDTCEAISGER